MTPQEKAPPGGQGQKPFATQKSKAILPHTGGSDYSGKVHNWGALPEEWDHWSTIAPLADLLPVVSDPHAVKSPDSKIQGPGKTPSDFNRRGEMRGIHEWTEYHATADDVAKWSADNRLGVCLQARSIRAIDVDVDDFDEALDIEQFIVDSLGYVPPTRRRSNSCKFLMLVDLPGDFTKRRFKTEKGVIEYLATGQQAVIAGTHLSGVRYEWDGGLPACIPAITVEQFESLWTALNTRFGTEASVNTRKGITPAKKRQIADIADPLVDFLSENGWVKDINRDGRVDVTCPWEDQHTSDSGDSASIYYPAGLGGFDQGHFNCMHSHCDHRTDKDFKDAIGWTANGMEDVPVERDPLPAFSRAESGKDKGKIEPTRQNLAMAISRPDICGHALRFDTFLDAPMIAVNGKWREFQDEDYYAIAMHLEQGSNGFKHIPTDTLREAVKFTCKQQQFDTAQAWLDSLTWDGVPRVDTFLSRYVGGPDTPYARAVSRYFWSALAGRVISPGVKADMALIAVGNQGAKKTSLVHALVPDGRFAGELDLSDDRKEIARSMRGKLVMELGELSGFSKRSVEHLKAFISRQKEEWTPKFKEFTTTVLRRCMFFGTTNSDEILVDETGNRRWLPFRSTGADPAGLAKVREQLWAEGAVLFNNNGVLWQDAERLAKDVHAEFTVSDTWDDRVHTWLYTNDDMAGGPEPAYTRFTCSEALDRAVNTPVSKQTKALEIRMGKILARFGFERIQERIPKTERDQATGSRTHRWVYQMKTP